MPEIRNTFRTFLQLFFCLLLYTNSLAQDPFPDYSPIYKDDVIARIDITIPPDSLAVIVAPGNEESEYYFHATFLFDNGTIRDTFENIGFQLRGNTSRYADKKSFQVSLNTYAPGRLWYGVEKLNLNGEHNDPSVSRSKICWDLLRAIGVPAPRSSHAELYINGDYFGLYANIEHIDEEFVKTRFGNNDGNLYKCLWPADLKYLGDDPDLYKLLSGGRRVYELKTNEEKDDYTDLAHLIDILNNTPVNELRCELETIFNINSFLLSMAFDILSGNWDGPLYNKNNFYLYHNLETGLFEYLPYDLDNTFGIDWFGIKWAERNLYNWGHTGESRPLYWNILQVPEYKDRLSFYLNQIIEEHYKESVLFPKLDALKIMLAPSVEDDIYYAMDYGFSIDDFNKSFSQALPYFHTPIGIKSFIATRRSTAINQLEINDIAPIIREVKTNHPTIPELIAIRCFVEDDQAIVHVQAFVEWNGTGTIEPIDMHDDGQHLDGEASDGMYGCVLPPAGTCSVLTFTIAAADTNGNQDIDPVCGTRELSICNSLLTLAVNEFMASNETTITDDYDEYEDWVEIFNYGTEGIYLGDKYLSDKTDNPTKWRFPDISIQAGEYILIWADEDGNQGDLHANFKLGAGGEFIGIFDTDSTGNALIDGLEFGAQETDKAFGRFPNGTGAFQLLNATPGSMNEITSAIIDEDQIFAYHIYPNPANDVIYVEIDQLSEVGQQIVLLNIFGQRVIEKMGQKRLRFEVGHLPNGMYLLGLKGNLGFQILETVIKD